MGHLDKSKGYNTRSFAAVPPQLTWLSSGLLSNLLSLGTLMFEWGIKLAAPVLAGVLITLRSTREGRATGGAISPPSGL